MTTGLLRQSERLARWALAVATYHLQPRYVERGRRLYPLLFADAVYRAASRARVKLALDVGGHCGEFGMSLRRAGYAGPIVSFEPNPAAARALGSCAARDGAWRVCETALGRVRSEGWLNRPVTTQFASLHPTLPYGHERWGNQVKVQDVVPVSVRRLDEVFESIVPPGSDPTCPGPLLLKVDTQGSDLDVLEGAGRILGEVAVLVIELSLIPMYEGAPNFVEALQYAEKAGFALAAVVPVTHDTASGVPIELDGCFVRRPVSLPARAPESPLHTTQSMSMLATGTSASAGDPGQSTEASKREALRRLSR